MTTRNPAFPDRHAWKTDGLSWDRLLELYRIALEANRTGDADRVRRSLQLLRSRLDYASDPVLANFLYRIYGDCESAFDERDHARVGYILEALHGLWSARRRLENLPHSASRENPSTSFSTRFGNFPKEA